MQRAEVEDMGDERTLSPKKIDRVKKMRAEGFTVREIAGALKVSSKTVMKYAPDQSIVKVEQELMPQQFIIPTELALRCAEAGITPVFEETTRRIYFKRLN